jgi:type II secretory ATPase GspE/PulE/Tfp pilus assembly ATPase PilB-like protein
MAMMQGSVSTDLSCDVHDLPTEQVVGRLIEFAASKCASDLLFAAEENRISVSIRHLGIPRLISLLTLELGRRCVSHIKAAANMDFVEHRRPQDARWLHECPNHQILDLRINILPTLFGEDVSIRLLNRQSDFVELARIGMIERVRLQFEELLRSPSGLVLVTGPTGAGKTTTLYAATQFINDGARKINTIEDPIEYALPNVRQSQINPSADLDFPELLRAVLRQAPDVIMVGEIRDSITAEIAVRAANSGQLVLATLHAPGAAAAIHSLHTLGIPSHFLGPSLSCVLSQRLVRTLCGHCRLPGAENPWPILFNDVAALRPPSASQDIFAAKGCPRCHLTGFESRTGVFELVSITHKLRHLVYADGSAGEIYRLALQEGMIPFRTAAFLKVADGATSPDEIRRVFPFDFLQN